jgi:hypothetical protein
MGFYSFKKVFLRTSFYPNCNIFAIAGGKTSLQVQYFIPSGVKFIPIQGLCKKQ